MRYLMNFFVKSNRGVHHGFTVLEVLMMVVILGIVATLAVPALQSGVEGSRLSGAAGEIAVALEYAQFVAMASGEQTRVTIDATDDTVLVERSEISGDITGAATQLPENDIDSEAFATVAHPAKRGEDYYIVFADEDRLKSVDIASATFGAGNSVTFNATGAPAEGGTVTLSLGSRQIILTVDSLSGKVTSSS